MIIVFGRRRIGKSELVRQAVADVAGAVVYQAAETTAAIQLESFVEAAARPHPGVRDVRLAWEPLLGYLAEEDAVVVVDEFPYLIASEPSVPSLFQRAWDQRFRGTRATLVLIGSSISVMEEKVLSGGSPLHGRRTASIDLGPLPPGHARTFYPAWGPGTATVAWSIFGGTPHYLQAIDASLPLPQNVQGALLSPRGLLHDEPRVLLRSELERPNTYFGILDAMAQGKRERNEIAQAAGLDASSMGSYLAKLERLRVIRRDVPVTDDPARSRSGRYRIADPLFRFWFRFVHGHKEALQQLADAAFERLVEPKLASHASEAFEELCHLALPRLVPAPYTHVGRWWHKENEVDAVGLTGGDRIVLGECRFTKEPVGPALLSKLEGLVDEIRWTPPDGGPVEPVYALFARSGFTPELEEVAQDREDVHLFGLEDVWGALG